MDKMKNIWEKMSNFTKIILLLIIGIAAGFLIQEIINFLFLGKFSLFYKVFSSSDILIYWGSIFGGLFGASIAIAGIYLTMQHNENENYEKDRKAVLPLFILSRLTLIEENETKKYFIENSLTRKKVIYIKKDTIIAKESINDNEIRNISTEKREKDLEGNTIKISHKKLKYASLLPIELISMGNGPIINASIRIERKNVSIDDQNNSKYFMAEHYIIGEKSILVFFLEEEVEETIELLITYEDIYNNEYSQSFKINSIFDNNIFITEIDLNINQTLISKD